ncbi:MAG: ATP-dependent RecD-like DNA helicase [Epsilonproteobacteria bacterium]|nr:ATP-dependent RecD-like DNA helicase [Campylobacterota bacterium]|tara:strand:- start:1228 stop:3402 length:2175 start_codon:yes stop_codon:yes gene_type:complete
MNNEQLSGIIDKFLFRNEETGFSVFILIGKNKNKTTITGTFTNIQAGQEIHLDGSWNFHAKFGKQFVASSYTTQLPTSAVGIKKYLGSGFIKGIGKVYAEKIVNYFGANTLTVIDEYPDKLAEVEGIGVKRITQIKQSWTDQKFIAKIMVFLQEKGVTSTYATKIYKKYGNQAIALLTQNPYRLTDDIWGIGFAMADKIAQNMGFATGSVQRFQAGILYLLSQESNNGHVYQEVADLKNKTFQLLALDSESHQSIIKQALTDLYHNEKIKLITHNKKHYIGLSSLYGSEKGITQKILQLLQAPSKHNIPSQELYNKLQENMDIPLNNEQQEGILRCIQEKISIITGGPGTGKTTLVKTLLTLLDTYNINYKLAAPTGRAAKRMMESTKRHAMTIHRLLEFDPSIMGFARNEQNALQTDLLIIDEASMIDIFLMHSIVKALSHNTHLVLIGDIDQLPSVGPGNVLKDLITSKKIPCTKLEHIFRQAQNSMIIQNAHNINQGVFPSGSIEGCKKDFYFIKEDLPENTFKHIQNILKTTIKKHHIDIKNVTVLTPMNRGAVGTQKLNFDLQQLLNPDTTSQQASFAGTIYKVHDRVMQIRNNYDKKIFNGDIGTITSIDTEEKIVTVNFDEHIVTYSFDELNELVLAYAVTIHKSQGSEYDAIIIPIFMQHFMLLQRNLIYTAITRAKKLCIFIGQPKAVAMGINNAKQEKRITFLDTFLTENLSCR